MCSRGAELGAIQICHALAVNSKFPCRHQLLGHDTATTYHGVKVSERFWTCSCSRVPCVSQRTRRRSAQRQSTALTQQKREDDAWLPLPASGSRPPFTDGLYRIEGSSSRILKLHCAKPKPPFCGGFRIDATTRANCQLGPLRCTPSSSSTGAHLDKLTNKIYQEMVIDINQTAYRAIPSTLLR